MPNECEAEMGGLEFSVREEQAQLKFSHQPANTVSLWIDKQAQDIPTDNIKFCLLPTCIDKIFECIRGIPLCMK